MIPATSRHFRCSTPPGEPADKETPDFTRLVDHFLSGGDTRCEAWFYLPKASYNQRHVMYASYTATCPKPPVILMAHGMGAQKDHKLPEFAEKFCKAGFAVYLFDYRHWGGSDGEPRHLVSARKQMEDYHSALQHVKV